MKNHKKGTKNLTGTQEEEIRMTEYLFSFADTTSLVVKKRRRKKVTRHNRLKNVDSHTSTQQALKAE